MRAQLVEAQEMVKMLAVPPSDVPGEKDLVVTQNEWLSQELESKSMQLIQLRMKRFTSMADLNSQISAKNEEVRRG